MLVCVVVSLSKLSHTPTASSTTLPLVVGLVSVGLASLGLVSVGLVSAAPLGEGLGLFSVVLSLSKLSHTPAASSTTPQ
jgi:hypothetical protein